jgi:hypothetical protein
LEIFLECTLYVIATIQKIVHAALINYARRGVSGKPVHDRSTSGQDKAKISDK